MRHVNVWLPVISSSDRQETPAKVVIDRDASKDGQMDFQGILPGMMA